MQLLLWSPACGPGCGLLSWALACVAHAHPDLLPQPAPYCCKFFCNCAPLQAAGAVLSLVDAVMAAAPCSGQAQQAQQQEQRQQQAPTAFAICRPPGHHAIPKGAMGFCIFSNAAIAARYAQQSHGAKKVGRRGSEKVSKRWRCASGGNGSHG